jgi:phage tail-like protein
MSQDTNPYGNYYFALEIGGVEVAHFMECSGLKTSSQVFEIEEGGLNSRTHKRPGQSRWENIVLRYATNTSIRLLQWRDTYLQDMFGDKKNGSITLKNNAGEPIRSWTFKNAWPVSWEGPSLNSGSSELAVETLELAHDGLEVGNS